LTEAEVKELFNESFEEHLENSNRNNLINIEIISNLEKIFFKKLEEIEKERKQKRKKVKPSAMDRYLSCTPLPGEEFIYPLKYYDGELEAGEIFTLQSGEKFITIIGKEEKKDGKS
jgi:hypothetical protein